MSLIQSGDDGVDLVLGTGYGSDNASQDDGQGDEQSKNADDHDRTVEQQGAEIGLAKSSARQIRIILCIVIKHGDGVLNVLRVLCDLAVCQLEGGLVAAGCAVTEQRDDGVFKIFIFGQQFLVACCVFRRNGSAVFQQHIIQQNFLGTDGIHQLHHGIQIRGNDVGQRHGMQPLGFTLYVAQIENACHVVVRDGAGGAVDASYIVDGYDIG